MYGDADEIWNNYDAELSTWYSLCFAHVSMMIKETVDSIGRTYLLLECIFVPTQLDSNRLD